MHPVSVKMDYARISALVSVADTGLSIAMVGPSDSGVEEDDCNPLKIMMAFQTLLPYTNCLNFR